MSLPANHYKYLAPTVHPTSTNNKAKEGPGTNAETTITSSISLLPKQQLPAQ
jgi:hypothetical protein